MLEIIGSFIPSENENIKLWRYMDFTKFVYLLEKSSLYFARSDTFKDPFEGAATKHTIDLREALRFLEHPDLEPYMPFKIDDIPELRKAMRKCISISCWHQNDYESAAMWDLYVRSGEGICVQTTYRRLEKSFIDPPKVYFGKVEYIDHATYDKNFPGGETAQFLLKGKSFEHEKEYRALIFNSPQSGGKTARKQFEQTLGYSLKCDLSILIENIYVSPASPSWLKNLVEAVVQRYGYNIIPKQSSLDREPVY